MNEPRLRILHETNPEKYFPALFFLDAQHQVNLTGTHRYSVFKEWLRSWLKDKSAFSKRTKNSIGDFVFRLSVPFVSGETIVVGFAPWDWRILIYRHLAHKNKILYQTSWHDWHFESTPRQPNPEFFRRYLQRVWLSFVAHENVKVIAVTPVVARSVKSNTGVDATVIPHSVPRQFFEAGAQKERQNTKQIRLLYVGEISEKKGMRALIELMKRLQDTDIELTVVGNGPLATEIERAAHSITYLGPIYDRERLARVMSEHDVFLLLSQKTPAWEELFGIVIIEAIAAGLAVLASNHVGPQTILGDIQAQCLFEETDIDGVEKLLRVFSQDQTQLAKLSREQQPIAQRYAIEPVAADWRRMIAGQDTQ